MAVKSIVIFDTCKKVLVPSEQDNLFHPDNSFCLDVFERKRLYLVFTCKEMHKFTACVSQLHTIPTKCVKVCVYNLTKCGGKRSLNALCFKCAGRSAVASVS